MPSVESSSCVWSREEDKQFEKAIATYPEETCDRWEKIAGEVAGKSVEEIKHHYELLLDDVSRIESGFVEVPCYNSSSSSDASTAEDGAPKKGANSTHLKCDGFKPSRSDQERRKGIAWTEDEHRLFLLGLEKYGKGDWRSISRNFVVTRTPTQVASHAQKYFIRLNSMNKDRRRSSIHDITNVEGGDVSAPQAPITGQSTVRGPNAKSGKQSPRGSMYGHPIVGTPVNLPPPPPPHMTYGVPVLPGPTMNMTYPMPHTSVRR